jgi:hypothetical protein
MWLWNWLMPKFFGLATITFWEGLGLFLLAHILFGFGSSSHSDDSGKKHHKKNHRHGGEPKRRTGKTGNITTTGGKRTERPPSTPMPSARKRRPTNRNPRRPTRSNHSEPKSGCLSHPLFNS